MKKKRRHIPKLAPTLPEPTTAEAATTDPANGEAGRAGVPATVTARHMLTGSILLAFAIVMIGGLMMPRLASHWIDTRGFPYQLDDEEGFIAWQAAALARGESIYRPLDRPPFIVGNYTPLFPAVYGWLNGPRVGPGTLPLGRDLTIGATLLCAALLALIVGMRTRRWMPAALAPLLFLGSYEVHHWSPFVRVDLPALALTLGGLALFALSRRRRAMAGAALLFVAAIYTRQTAILAPLACMAALARHRGRLLPWFVGPLLAAGLGTLAWLEWRTGGEFLRHTIIYNKNRMDWTGWTRLMRNEVWLFYRWWLAAMLAAVICRLAQRVPGLTDADEDETTRAGDPLVHDGRFREPRHARHVMGIYAVLATISLLGYAKVGAAPNYLLEPLAAWAIWGAESMARLMDRLGGKANRGAWLGVPRVLISQAAVWIVGLLLVAHAGWLQRRPPIPPGVRAERDPGPLIYSSAKPDAPDRVGGDELRRRARAAQGDVYSEQPIFTMLAGKPVLWQPFIMAQLAREERWNPAPLLAMLREGRFGLMIEMAGLDAPDALERVHDRYTPAMVEAIRARYRPAAQVVMPGLGRTYTIWEPRTLDATTSTATASSPTSATLATTAATTATMTTATAATMNGH